MRTGIGYDVHRLTMGRKLILGGVEIPFSKGLGGHSDADVLVHAICDALLGAAGLGDIGIHFPDTDPVFKDISSMKLLKKTCDLLQGKRLSVSNIDATVFAEAPKISDYRMTMEKNISSVIGISPNCINVKATTTEGLGMIGKGEGIGALAIVLLA